MALLSDLQRGALLGMQQALACSAWFVNLKLEISDLFYPVCWLTLLMAHSLYRPQCSNGEMVNPHTFPCGHHYC